MKKLLAMTVALGLVASFGLTACGGGNNKDKKGGNDTAKTCVAATAAKAKTQEACTAAHGKFTEASGEGANAVPASCACAAK